MHDTTERPWFCHYFSRYAIQLLKHQLSASISLPTQIHYSQKIILSVRSYSAVQNLELASKHLASFMPRAYIMEQTLDTTWHTTQVTRKGLIEFGVVIFSSGSA